MLAILVAGAWGCASGPQLAPQAIGPTAIQVPTANRDRVWEHTANMLNEMHFQIARESKLEGVIETYPRVAANVLELWHPDSVGLQNRLEGTLQSIRRTVTVRFQENSADTTTVQVHVLKEIEDVPGPAANSPGGATFSESQPLTRDLDQVLGQAAPSQWLPRGTDPALEAEITRRIRFGR